jgi:ammonium transporter, Amt family
VVRARQTIILWVMHYIPGLRIRLSSPEAEIIGIDDAEMGEFAYDYVGIDAELGSPDSVRTSMQGEAMAQKPQPQQAPAYHQDAGVGGKEAEGSSLGEVTSV